MRSLLPALALPALLACGGGATVKTLPNGHSYRILHGGQVRFDDGSTAAMIVYETEKRPDDQKGIQAEAEELWEAYRPDIEKTGQTKAIIQANQPKHLLLLQKDGVIAGFTWEKQADGTWAEKQ